MLMAIAGADGALYHIPNQLSRSGCFWPAQQISVMIGELYRRYLRVTGRSDRTRINLFGIRRHIVHLKEIGRVSLQLRPFWSKAVQENTENNSWREPSFAQHVLVF